MLYLGSTLYSLYSLSLEFEFLDLRLTINQVPSREAILERANVIKKN